MNKTLKLTLITIAIIILGLVGYKVLASNKQETVKDEQDLFLDKRTPIENIRSIN